jgi:putative ABC transport system ATP-binding protein
MIYNNKYSKQEKREQIENNLSIVGLLDKMNQKPLQLSGGQQQRVAIARALVNNPEIIFADEPTGSLDSDTGIEIMDLLKELNKKGKTIIMVTHDEDLTKYASKVIKLKDGLIMEEV